MNAPFYPPSGPIGKPQSPWHLQAQLSLSDTLDPFTLNCHFLVILQNSGPCSYSRLSTISWPLMTNSLSNWCAQCFAFPVTLQLPGEAWHSWVSLLCTWCSLNVKLETETEETNFYDKMYNRISSRRVVNTLTIEKKELFLWLERTRKRELTCWPGLQAC